MDNLQKQFKDAAHLLAQPAPSRSLETPAIGSVVKNALQTHNNVYFGERHDDVNMKFLADNPAIFQEARAQGAKYMFSETYLNFAPTVNAYYDGKISHPDFQKNLKELYSYTTITSGDSPESMAKNMAEFVKTAKDNGIQVLPSDFRILTPAQQQSSALFTSDAYGIPDIQGRDDAVRHQTLRSLQLYQDKYPDRNPLPTLPQEQHEFAALHARAVSKLPPAEKEQFKTDMATRKDEFSKDTSVGHVNLQNQLQADYYSRMVEPGEKALFLGGRDHAMGAGSTSEILKDRGYGTTTSIELMSNAENALNKIAPASHLDYTVMTEKGEIFDAQNRRIEVASLPLPSVSRPPPPPHIAASP